MEGDNLCFVWADFFLLHQTPFPASGPGEKQGEYMILVRWSGLVLKSSHQLGLLQQLKVTDPRAFRAVVGLSEMHYGTSILFVPMIYDAMKIISVLSSFKGSQAFVIKDNKYAKIAVCKVVQVDSTVEGFYF